MIFTHAEIEVLRLSAWCKDLPIGSTEIFPQYTVKLLCRMGLIRESRCGLSYRTTQEGYKVLQKGGFDYVPDKQYRGRGSVLTRRLETAEIAGFFWRYGADVFRDTPDTEKNRLTFLPSFALRRKNYANVLGGTRLAGFLYTLLYRIISRRKAKVSMQMWSAELFRQKLCFAEELPLYSIQAQAIWNNS